MTSALRIASLLALCAAIFAGVAVGLAALSAQRATDAATYWLQSPDAQGIVANVTVVTRHAITSLDKADAVSDAAKKSADESVNTQREFAATVKQARVPFASLDALFIETGRSLNDQRAGLLPQLTRAIVGVAGIEEQLKKSVIDADALLTDSSVKQLSATALIAMQNVQEGTAQGKEMLSHLNVTAAEMQQILYDLQHPERPSKWVRAISIMLSILKTTSLMGQSAPVFNH